MYASLALQQYVTLLQFISRNFNLNLPIDFEFAFMYKFLLKIFLFSNIPTTKENWKMTGDVDFYNP